MLIYAAVAIALIAHDPHGSHHPHDVCVCETVAVSDGWCEKCHVGYFATVRITSETLFQTLDLHGHAVIAERTKCTTCRPLIAGGGYCDQCHMGFIDGKGFFSRPCYQMAKGQMVEPAAKQSPCCDAASGWCTACERGVVANRVFDKKDNFTEAQAGFALIQAAADKTKDCELCAAAMIADGRCRVCKIVFAQGKPVAAQRKTTNRGG